MSVSHRHRKDTGLKHNANLRVHYSAATHLVATDRLNDAGVLVVHGDVGSLRSHYMVDPVG